MIFIQLFGVSKNNLDIIRKYKIRNYYTKPTRTLSHVRKRVNLKIIIMK